jgi:hypothetical protein
MNKIYQNLFFYENFFTLLNKVLKIVKIRANKLILKNEMCVKSMVYNHKL